MGITTQRNLNTDSAPSRAGAVMVMGDSIANLMHFGPGSGAMLKQIDALAGLSGCVEVWNAGYGGFKMLGSTGTTEFLDFSALTDSQGMTDAKAVRTAAGTIDALIISLGPNDLADVEGAPSPVVGYNEAKIEAGMQAVISGIRTHNSTPSLPVFILVPGRDRSSGSKAGGGQTWRKAMVDVATADANVHLVEYYDIDIEDSVHPGLSGQVAIGFRLGRLVAKHAYSASGVGGTPSISSISKTSSTKVRITFSIPSGETLIQPKVPTGWRVEDATDSSELRIARLDWVSATQADLVLADASAGGIKIMAPYDLCQGITAPGIIRTNENGDDHDAGFALQSFEGTAS